MCHTVLGLLGWVKGQDVFKAAAVVSAAQNLLATTINFDGELMANMWIRFVRSEAILPEELRRGSLKRSQSLKVHELIKINDLMEQNLKIHEQRLSNRRFQGLQPH